MRLYPANSVVVLYAGRVAQCHLTVVLIQCKSFQVDACAVQPGSPNFSPLDSAAYATLGGAPTAIGARSTTRSQANVIAAGAILSTYDTGPLTGEQSSCGASGKVRLTCARLVPELAARRYASQKSPVVCGSRFVMMVSSAVMVHVTDPH